MKTILKDRILWGDGEITFTPDQLMDFVLNGGEITMGIHVTALNDDIRLYNQLHPSLMVNVKRDLNHLDTTWNIPQKYKNINIKSYVGKRLAEEVEAQDKRGESFTDKELNVRIDRVEEELKLYQQNDMDIILKTVIYIVDTFKMNGIVWGTGRGSSCSSYILYLLELHSVDSVKYELDLHEFFK